MSSAALLVVLLVFGVAFVAVVAFAAVALQGRLASSPAGGPTSALGAGVRSLEFQEGPVQGRVRFDAESCNHQTLWVTRFEFTGGRSFSSAFRASTPGLSPRSLLPGRTLPALPSPSGFPPGLDYAGDLMAAPGLGGLCDALLRLGGLARFELRVDERGARVALLGHVTEPESVEAVAGLLIAFLRAGD
jgi:hypothetical protein